MPGAWSIVNNASNPRRIMRNDVALQKRIEELERENRALRHAASQPGKRNAIVVTESSYQGHPTISFDGPGRPFTLGLRKAAVVLYCLEEVRQFVARHNGEIKNMEILPSTAGSFGIKAPTDVQI